MQHSSIAVRQAAELPEVLLLCMQEINTYTAYTPAYITCWAVLTFGLKPCGQSMVKHCGQSSWSNILVKQSSVVSRLTSGMVSAGPSSAAHVAAF
jgi:hypothetical protein